MSSVKQIDPMAMAKRKLHDSNMIIGDSSMCDLELEEEYINNDPL